jgi:HK97 family phage major capsid protein
VQTVSNAWQAITVGQVTSALVSEYSEVTDSSPTFTGPSIPVYKSSVFVPVSLEANMDIPDFASQISALLGDSAANWEANLMTLGTGTANSQPCGASFQIGATTASRVSSTTAAQYGRVDFYKLSNALPPRHRPNASWVMENTVVNLTRDFGRTLGSGYTVDLTSPPSEYLMGKRWYECSSMTSQVTSGKDVVLYGDFSNFVVARRSGFAIE